MELLETAWKGFRNLKPRRQQWRPGLNVILGSNGIGKTNLLESFNIICGWGPFPGGRTSVLPNWEGDGRALLSAAACGERDFDVLITISTRLFMKAGGERVTYSELRALLPSLSFLPRDIDLIDGSPSVRRLFLDKLCALFSPLYARRLSEYRQIIRHRAVLLRKNRPPDPTAIPMIQFGAWLWKVRMSVAAALRDEMKFDMGLLPCEVELAVERRAFAEGRELRRLDWLEIDEEAFREILNASSERERQAGFALVGPHRDDLLFSCLGHPASASLSRGQKRRVVAAALMAAGRLIEKKIRRRPILLFDDVAAELDADGRALLGNALISAGWQVFVTGIEDPFPLLSPDSKEIFDFLSV